jgi:hypothetical protein
VQRGQVGLDLIGQRANRLGHAIAIDRAHRAGGVQTAILFAGHAERDRAGLGDRHRHITDGLRRGVGRVGADVDVLGRHRANHGRHHGLIQGRAFGAGVARHGGNEAHQFAGDDIHRFVDGRQEGGEGQSAHDFGLSEMKKPAHGGLGIASDWVASRRLSCRP